MTEYEKEILDRYSTPGLRIGELTRQQKHEHLRGQGLPPSEIQKILDRIYGEDNPLRVAEL